MKRLLFYISLILIIFIVVVVNLSTTNFRGEIGVQEQEYYADGQTPESRQYDGNHKLTEIRTYTRAEGEFNLPPEGMTIVNNNVYFALVKHTKNPDVYVSSLVSWPLSNPSANFTTRIQPTENLWHANDFTYNPDKRILLGATAKKEIGLYAATLDTQGRIYRFTNYPNSNSKVFTYSGVAYNYDKGNYIGYREGKFYSFDVELDDDNFDYSPQSINNEKNGNTNLLDDNEENGGNNGTQ